MGCPCSLKENADPPAWLFQAVGITVGTVALLFHTELNAWANVGIYSFSDVVTRLLSPAEAAGKNQGTHGTLSLWGRDLCCASGRRELRFINTQGKGALHSESCHSHCRDTCPVCSAQGGQKTEVFQESLAAKAVISRN